MPAVAIVSGGTSGIGRAVARRLAADGYQVVAFGSDPAKVAALREESAGLAAKARAADVTGAALEEARDGPSLEARTADVTDAAQVGALVEEVLERHGRVDVLCPAAGVKVAGTLAQTDLDAWERTFAVNVRGAYLLTKAVLPAMLAQRAGSIVYIGSPSGYGGVAHAAYCASKGALHALATSVALDHVEDGIRVNTIVPGSTRTGMNDDRPEEVFERLGRANVAGRVNEPEDVAAAVAFLVSPAAETISGARIEVGAVAGQGVLGLGGERG